MKIPTELDGAVKDATIKCGEAWVKRFTVLAQEPQGGSSFQVRGMPLPFKSDLKMFPFPFLMLSWKAIYPVNFFKRTWHLQHATANLGETVSYVFLKKIWSTENLHYPSLILLLFSMARKGKGLVRGYYLWGKLGSTTELNWGWTDCKHYWLRNWPKGSKLSSTRGCEGKATFTEFHFLHPKWGMYPVLGHLPLLLGTGFPL